LERFYDVLINIGCLFFIAVVFGPYLLMIAVIFVSMVALSLLLFVIKKTPTWLTERLTTWRVIRAIRRLELNDGRIMPPFICFFR